MKTALFVAFLVFALGKQAFAEVKFESGQHEPIARLTNTKAVPGITAAGSTYVSKTEKLETVGSASLVLIKKTGRVVALTAAHVVSGEKPWVEVNGKKIPATKWLFDNDRDIAVLELPKLSTTTALIFEGEELKVQSGFMKKIDQGKIPTVLLAYYIPGTALGFALRPWVNRGVETQWKRAIVHAPVVSLNHDGEQVRIFTKVTSGASGSAVLDLRQQRVAGLIVQSHYYMSETYLASADVLRRHFQLYVAGDRGTTSETKWKLANRLVYRAFKGGIEEAIFAQHRTSGVLGQPGAGVIGQPGGQGVIGQPGNGVIGQPGNGVIAQPGNGIIAQPGNGIIAQPGNGVIAQPTKTKSDQFLPWSENPQAVFEFFNLKPGMNWQGKAVIGLNVKAKQVQAPWPEQFTLLAEPEAVRFLQKDPTRFEYTTFGLETDFVQLLRGRLGLAGEKSVRLQTEFGPSAIVDDLEQPTESDKCIVDVGTSEIKIKVKTFARMNRETWELVPDEIEFTLQSNGALKEQKEFSPVIQTKGLLTGETYYVDLRQFFFIDVSQLMRKMPDWSHENPPFGDGRFDLKTQLTTAGFSVRNASSGAEFTYGFTAPRPLPKP